MVDQQALEEEVRVPPYYERFLEERDKRLSSEFGRLETEIRHNREGIDELKGGVSRLDSKIDNVRAELKADIARLDNKIDEVRAELKADIARLDNKIDEVRAELKADIARLDNKIDEVRAELKADIARLDSKLDSHFRWMLTLFLPVILGVVALLIQNLLR